MGPARYVLLPPLSWLFTSLAVANIFPRLMLGIVSMPLLEGFKIPPSRIGMRNSRCLDQRYCSLPIYEENHGDWMDRR